MNDMVRKGSLYICGGACLWLAWTDLQSAKTAGTEKERRALYLLAGGMVLTAAGAFMSASSMPPGGGGGGNGGLFDDLPEPPEPGGEALDESPGEHEDSSFSDEDDETPENDVQVPDTVDEALELSEGARHG